jgi:hypothetical protein
MDRTHIERAAPRLEAVIDRSKRGGLQSNCSAKNFG